MWIFAFSLCFTRMRGLASRLVRPSVCLSESRKSGSVKVRRTRFWSRERSSGRVSVPGVPVAPAAVDPPTRLTAAEPGKRTPSSISRLKPISSTSTSSITRSEEHTSELQSRVDLVCRLLLEKKNKNKESRYSSHNDNVEHTEHTD